MRIIITGGSGLIGRALANSLAADQHEVVLLSRSPGRVTNLPSNVRAVAWDGHTAQGWGELADGAGAIVNLAGESIAGEGFLPLRWSDERRQRIRDSRINAGRAVTAAVAGATQKPRVVIQASAIGYYGVHGDEALDESAPAGNDFLANVCREWEASSAGVETAGVRRVIIRIGVVLSTQGGALTRVLLPYRLFGGGRFGSGRQYWSWIHLDDVVRAIRASIEDEQFAGPINLTAPNPHTNNDFGKTLGQVLGRPHWLPVPAFALKLPFGEVTTVVLDGQRVLPAKLQHAGFTFQFPQLAPALQDLLKRNV